MNSLKIAVIKQAAGAGDIFFCQKIAYVYQQLGYKIIWPIIPQYLDIAERLSNFNYPNIEEDFEFKYIWQDSSSIIKSFEDHILKTKEKATGSKIMKAKYEMTNIDWSDWKQYFNFLRDQNKENELMKTFGIKENEEYNFILRTYGSPPHSLIDHRVKIDNENIKTIEMSYLQGYNLFDWCSIIENASFIFINDSSINFLIEKLNLKIKQPIKLWTRRGNDFSEIDYMFNNNLYEFMI